MGKESGDTKWCWVENHPVFPSVQGKPQVSTSHVSPLLSHRILHFWHLRSPNVCVFSPYIKQFCNISWVSYNLTQFWHYLPGDSVTSHRLRAEFHKTAPHFRCQLQVVDPQVTHNFSLSWLQIRGSHDFLPLGFDYLLQWLTDSGKHLFRFTSLLKDMIKDPDEQPDEELHKARSGRVLSAGASVSSRVGVCHPFCTWMCSPNWKFSQPHVIAIFLEASSHRQVQLLTSFPVLLPSQEHGGWDWKF